MFNKDEFNSEFEGAKDSMKAQAENLFQVVNLIKEVAIPVAALVAVTVKVLSKLKK